MYGIILGVVKALEYVDNVVEYFIVGCVLCCDDKVEIDFAVCGVGRCLLVFVLLFVC